LRLETLKRRSEFDRVRKGRKWAAKGFILQGMPREGDKGGPPRFGFVMSGKALSSLAPGQPAKRAGAVIRNRAKRRLKEAIRLVAPQHALPNHDYAVIGRREVLHQRFSDLLEELQVAFGKVNLPPRDPDAGLRAKGYDARSKTARRQTEKSKRSAGQPPAEGDLK
jgi:ribonuclease P protein component